MKARRSHIFPKATDGHYVEPAWCSERLFAIESFGAPGALVLDPACGWGNIPRAAAAAGYTAMASDIVDRLDRRGLEDVRFHICNFLEESPVRSAWSIACNPPFDHIKEFCERGLEVATYKVAMIVPLRRLPAARWLESLPLESIYLLTPRPSMPPGAWIAAGNIPGGGREDFCWLVFNKRAGRWSRACAGCRALTALGGSPRRPAWCSLRLLHANVGHRLQPRRVTHPRRRMTHGEPLWHLEKGKTAATSCRS